MRSSNPRLGLCLLLFWGTLAGCGGGGGGGEGSAPAQPPAVQGPTGANVLSISVDGALCSAATSSGYFNKPCVSVTICNPGTAVCQTVNDILLDTGSYGLRIFKGAIPNLTLTGVASGPGALAGCIQFADGSSLWGPILLADVQLGSEPAVRVPIQVIDASFGTRPAACSNADATPASAGFTGVLGIGVLSEDCGPGCVNGAGNGIYYSCQGASCSGTTVPLANQVQNPAAQLSQDNNGIQIQLPAVPLGGSTSASGSLVLGIGTQSNNTPGTPTVIVTDQNGDFRTVFEGVSNQSFLDTGSNGLFFQSTSLPICPAPNTAWYCPPITRALLADTFAVLGNQSLQVPFNVGNMAALIGTPNRVFSEIAGPSGFGFDWGLPFFLGRTVYFGFAGKGGLGNTGPYVAY